MYKRQVFYNKILRAYVLIELKTTKLTPEAAGQLNMYLNYYAAEVNDEHDNPPIGIIPVSYTHLDVYKRQAAEIPRESNWFL